jgi:hypothetical protein
LDMVQLLLNAGAGTSDSSPKQFARAVALAKQEGHYTVAKLLSDHRN